MRGSDLHVRGSDATSTMLPGWRCRTPITRTPRAVPRNVRADTAQVREIHTTAYASILRVRS
eukprot:1349930-Prymnesium_polylepis.1